MSVTPINLFMSYLVTLTLCIAIYRNEILDSGLLQALCSAGYEPKKRKREDSDSSEDDDLKCEVLKIALKFLRFLMSRL